MSGVAQHDRLEIDDPIAEAFPVMVRAALDHCRPRGNGELDGSAAHGESVVHGDNVCFAYHRLWPYQRRVRPLTGALKYASYFVAQFRDQAQAGVSNRVLISANADYGLLAQVLYAFRAVGEEPDVTVLDLCEAPLAINRWYAQRHAARIRTVRSDIVDFESGEPYGAITTDNFLCRIPPDKRTVLLRKWHSLLRPGGQIVTTEGVLKEGLEQRVRHDLAHIETQVTRFLNRVSDSDLGALGVTRETMAQYVRAYKTAKSNYPFASVDELWQLFEGSGFRIERLSPAVGLRMKADEGQRHRRYEVLATRIGSR